MDEIFCIIKTNHFKMSVKFVETDSDTILSEILADFTTLTGRILEPSQPEYLLCSAMAYRVSIERQRMNTTGNSQLLEFSTAPILDYLLSLVGVTRLPAQYAVCTLQFTLIAGHGSVVIPQGTRVMSEDGQVVFATKTDTTVSADILVVNIDAECTSSGESGNKYEIGTIKEIQDVQAYLSSCINIDITSGGSDAETDEQLRTRGFSAPSQFSVAGPKDAYKFFALSASPLILDVAIVTYSEDTNCPRGQINIYPLLANGELANQALLDAIHETCSDDSIRPISDYIVVVNASKVEYSLTINIVKKTGSNNVEILALLNPLIIAFGKAKMLKLGLDIVNSEIEALCRVSGVYDVDVTIIPTTGILTGDNLVIKSSEFPFMANYSLNIISSNNG
jgi:phage-related baseplate assembly protein